MHWFVCNDAEKRVRGERIGGIALRAGRLFVHGKRRTAFKAFWSFWNNLNWVELEVRLGGEDGMFVAALILPRLAHVGFGFCLPRRWLSWWMIEDRVSSVSFGYAGSMARLQIAHAEWAEDCGMTDYYRKQVPRQYSSLQLWPGLEWTLRPDVARWIFGRVEYHCREIERKPVGFDLDGKKYEATWKLERRSRTRSRWPWEYSVRYSSNIEIEDPPRVSGKGENSWDCGDDAIYGFGSASLSPASAVGEYVKAVLENRERYGPPMDEFHV